MAPIGGDAYASYVGQYRRVSESPRGWKAGMYVAAGCCGLAALVLIRRAGTRRRLLGIAVLAVGLLAAVVALGSSPPVDPPSPTSIGIRQEADRLFAQAMEASDLLPPIAGELLPESDARFFERLSGNRITFARDSQGKATSFIAQSGGHPLSYERISDQPPPAPQPLKPLVAVKVGTEVLDACVGQYDFPPDAVSATGFKLTIWREGDQLMGQARGEKVIHGAFEICPQSETTFLLKINHAQLTFMKDDKGKVTGVMHRLAGYPDIEGTKLRIE
jgi:hypothetical protein